jgi:hypothetical protein
VILLPTLELPLLSVELLLSAEEAGALERMFDRRLVAPDVSPDFRSLSNELRESLSGLDLWDLWVWVELVVTE